MSTDSEHFVLSHIVAAAENNAIGAKGQLPWHLPNDFKYFKNKTWGMPVIMGRKSYEALKRVLPGRINIVVSARRDFSLVDAFVVHNIQDGIAAAKESDAREIFIIGGGEIFRQSIDLVSRIYLTRVHATVSGDTYYPAIDENRWALASQQAFPADEKNEYAYTFEVWEKKDGAF